MHWPRQIEIITLAMALCTQQISKASAAAVNEHFVSSVDAVVSSNMQATGCESTTFPIIALDNQFVFQKITDVDVNKQLLTMQKSGVTGADGISIRMLKFAVKDISSILANLFNTSIKMSAFPAAWKTGIVTPIFKRGCKYNIENYRPISILPVVFRLFERLLSSQL
jgi:hypothetical protein